MNQTLFLLFVCVRSVKEFEDIFAQDVIDLKKLRQQAFNGKLVYIFKINSLHNILQSNPQVCQMYSVSVR